MSGPGRFSVGRKACSALGTSILHSYQPGCSLTPVAQIWSPYFYPATDGPRYTKAFIINACFTGAAIALSLLLRECLRRENLRMDERERDGSDDDSIMPEKRVRYVL